MIVVIVAILALIVGGSSGYAVALRTRRPGDGAGRPFDASGVRWQRGDGHRAYQALRHLRRHFPTHEIVTGVRFLDLVEPKGNAAPDARRRCYDWTVAVVMVEKRTDRLARVVLRSDDVHAEEKRWVLRRAGIKVSIVEHDADEDAMRAAMAA